MGRVVTEPYRATTCRRASRGPWPDTLMGDRCARLRANLENFMEGDYISVCWAPFKARDHQLGRLAPVEWGVWDMRSRDKPGLRVFFCLAERDVMVAFICRPRSVKIQWLPWPPLGDRQSKRWQQAQSECRRLWSYLFPAHMPLVSENPDDCISKSRIV